ncbi:MAG TPA: hypothetical protein VFH51_11305, partial [Myxococcota bacterium]|nr:hypothetical protein [Myxococcota bacterium]
MSRLPGLPEFLSARLGIPVELLDVRGSLQALPGGPEAVGPEHALALGMAVALFRHGRELPLNFRRGELAYHGDIQLYRGTLTRAAIGMSIVLTLAILGSVVRYSILKGEEKQLDLGFCSATQRIVGREICDPTAAMATLRQSGGDGGVVIPSYSAASLLEMVSKGITPDLDVQLDEIDLRVDATPGQPERIAAKGEAASFETTEGLATALKKDPCVQDVEVSNQRKTHNAGRVEFKLVIKVACPVGVQPGSPAGARAATP